MNGYEPSTPRAALGLAAVAMATITMGALVILPAKFDSAGADASTPVMAKDAAEAPAKVAASPAHTDAPEAENRDVYTHSGHTLAGIQEFRGYRRALSSRSRTNF